MGVATDRNPQGHPGGPLCEGLLGLLCLGGVSRASNHERCVSTGFQKHERETRDSPVLTWRAMPSFLRPYFQNTSGSLSSRRGGQGDRLFELVTVGSARLIAVVLTSCTKHNFQLIKVYSKYSAQKSPLFKRHMLTLDAGADARADVGADVGADAGADAGADVATDASVDAGGEAGVEAGDASSLYFSLNPRTGFHK